MRPIEQLIISAQLDEQIDKKFGENASVVMEMLENSRFPELQKMKILNIIPRGFQEQDLGVETINYMTGQVTDKDGNISSYERWVSDFFKDNEKEVPVSTPEIDVPSPVLCKAIESPENEDDDDFDPKNDELEKAKRLFDESAKKKESELKKKGKTGSEEDIVIPENIRKRQKRVMEAI